LILSNFENNKKDMLKIGVLGAGHLGKIHIKCILQLDEFELVGFYDSDPLVREKIAKEYKLQAFSSVQELIQAVEVVDIVTPTLSHFECAKSAIIASKHIFIEKPITNTSEEAKLLINLSSEANVKVQIGHVERFNPAFLSIQDKIENPMFVETHRLAEFNPRGTDVSVIHDLMIHDIDIVLSIVRSNVKRISANGVAVVSDTPDIANARIEFDNGCVANLTASRVSLKNMRKTRIFQKNAYISIDFSEKTSEFLQIKNVTEASDEFSVILDLGEEKGKKEILFHKPKITHNNAIKDELQSFAKAIINNETPLVTVEDGYNALKIASIINDKIKFTSDNFSPII
jgi:predicted dehydrogenase